MTEKLRAAQQALADAIALRYTYLKRSGNYDYMYPIYPYYRN